MHNSELENKSEGKLIIVIKGDECFRNYISILKSIFLKIEIKL